MLIEVVGYFTNWWGMEWLKLIFYIVAFLPLGIPVMREGVELMKHEKSYFNEYTLMSVAAIGAFVIGEYDEAVLLLLLYQLGEYLEGRAVRRAKREIAELVDVRSETVVLLEGDSTREIPAKEAKVGDVLRVAPGMRVSLDAKLLSDEGVIDQSALTGESMLVERDEGDVILAGSVVSGKPIDIEVTKLYEDSTLARILKLTEEAAEHKPETERFIRRFAKVYTPIVFLLALMVVLVPWLVLGRDYFFTDWLYRGLVFLVISCPCALVISVPLSYFCGVGAMSRHGLLAKGAVYIEELRQVNTVVFDKTGTLTDGSFGVKELQLAKGVSREEALCYLLALEGRSTHPMAVAIRTYAEEVEPSEVGEIEELMGMGMQAVSAEGRRLLVGSERLMEKHGIATPKLRDESAVLLAVDDEVAAIVLLQDQPKARSVEAVKALHKLGVEKVLMLSGDKQEVVAHTASALGIEEAIGDLLPDDKMRVVERLGACDKVAFVGDGLNDAPVMRLSSVGIAMGGIGSDATIEAADVIIQTDDPFRVPQAIDISRFTHKVVVQNIIFALGFKLGVMLLAVLGFASLSLAVVADVGVTILAVANALRVLTYRSKVQ